MLTWLQINFGADKLITFSEINKSVLHSKLVSAVPKWSKHEVYSHTGTCCGPESSGEGKVVNSVWISQRGASLTSCLLWHERVKRTEARYSHCCFTTAFGCTTFLPIAWPLPPDALCVCPDKLMVSWQEEWSGGVCWWFRSSSEYVKHFKTICTPPNSKMFKYWRKTNKNSMEWLASPFQAVFSVTQYKDKMFHDETDGLSMSGPVESNN